MRASYGTYRRSIIVAIALFLVFIVPLAALILATLWHIVDGMRTGSFDKAPLDVGLGIGVVLALICI